MLSLMMSAKRREAMMADKFILLGVVSTVESEIEFVSGPDSLSNTEDAAQQIVEDEEREFEYLFIVPVEQAWNITELRAESEESETEEEDE